MTASATPENYTTLTDVTFRLIVDARVLLAVTMPPALLSLG